MIGNIRRRDGLGPAPDRRCETTWAQFIRRHQNVLWGKDYQAGHEGSIPITRSNPTLTNRIN